MNAPAGSPSDPGWRPSFRLVPLAVVWPVAMLANRSRPTLVNLRALWLAVPPQILICAVPLWFAPEEIAGDPRRWWIWVVIGVAVEGLVLSALLRADVFKPKGVNLDSVLGRAVAERAKGVLGYAFSVAPAAVGTLGVFVSSWGPVVYLTGAAGSAVVLAFSAPWVREIERRRRVALERGGADVLEALLLPASELPLGRRR